MSQRFGNVTEQTVELLLATSNPHKLEEARAILGPRGIRIVDLGQIGADVIEPIEDATTFVGNARIKARYYASHMGCTCLADDSGLEVDALDGRPGVHSARYAGVGKTRQERDEANNRKLIAELQGGKVDHPTARFICCLCLAAPDGNIITEVQGSFEGVLTTTPKGTNGFGYDPLLYLPDMGCTSAELDPAVKNARSHRGQALRLLAQQLPSLIASDALSS